MYLNKSKKRFQEWLDLDPSSISYEPCTVEDFDSIRKTLGLSLPKSYEEMLLWFGRGCEPLYSYGGGKYYSTPEANLKELAHDIMEINHFLEPLPDDAIVFWLFDEDAEFAFIRASEGDDPPVHHFGCATENGRILEHSEIKWNWCANLDEFFLLLINDYIDLSGLEHYCRLPRLG